MQTRADGKGRGFSLVELMIAVAIVGVLAALAVVGVRRYLAAAKSSEARMHVGAIARGAVAAYERETAAAEILPEGAKGSGDDHDVCNTAKDVPTNVPAGKKYQPRTGNGLDFETGDANTGWRCVKFSVAQPIYYRYTYGRGTATQVAPANPASVAGFAKAFEAAAEGDLDGDGATSKFALTGKANLTTKQLVLATRIYVENELE